MFGFVGTTDMNLDSQILLRAEILWTLQWGTRDVRGWRTQVAPGFSDCGVGGRA